MRLPLLGPPLRLLLLVLVAVADATSRLLLAPAPDPWLAGASGDTWEFSSEEFQHSPGHADQLDYLLRCTSRRKRPPEHLSIAVETLLDSPSGDEDVDTIPASLVDMDVDERRVAKRNAPTVSNVSGGGGPAAAAGLLPGGTPGSGSGGAPRTSSPTAAVVATLVRQEAEQCVQATQQQCSGLHHHDAPVPERPASGGAHHSCRTFREVGRT